MSNRIHVLIVAVTLALLAGVGAAHFQTRWMGMFHGVLVASIERVDGAEVVRWGYGFPRDGADKYHAGIVTPPAADAGPATAWDFRPLDLNTGEPRPWVDAAPGEG